MPKPKSIVISFRLSPLVIAKAIDGLRHYNKTADIGKLSTIIKQAALHGINYMTDALPWEPSEQAQRIVQQLTSQGKQGISIEERILGSKSKATPKEKKEMKTQTQEAESFLEKQESASTKSTVTDFSMPEGLRQEIEE